jgi:putative PIN family toxin of toxin-antitoxin system
LNVVIDTNVLVSAALRPDSQPGRAFVYVRRHGSLLVSGPTLAELDKVLRRPRLDRFASLEGRIVFLAEFILLSEEVEIVMRVAACRDPKDDKFLEVAVNGRATHLVTGDGDLLALHLFRGIPILSPADFLAAVDPPSAP